MSSIFAKSNIVNFVFNCFTSYGAAVTADYSNHGGLAEKREGVNVDIS